MVNVINNKFYLEKIEHMLQLGESKAFGVGEMKHSNYSYKRKCAKEQKDAQLLFLCQGVQLAKTTNKVLVLHI